MLPTANEIKEKLVKALDDKNDIDEATVVDMVATLERFPITRATLEETRIGKMVNDLRRKIKNEKLAKRVKQLVRTWKQLLVDTPGPINGSPGPTHPSPSVSPALARSSASAGHLVSPAQIRKGLSPGLVAGRPITPTATRVASPALAGGRYKPQLTASVAGKMASPALTSRGVPPAVIGRLTSPAVSDRTASPVLAGRVISPAVSRGVASPCLPGRIVSPAAGLVASKAQSRPLMTTTPVRSPVQNTTQVTGIRNNYGSLQKQSLKGRASKSSTNGAGRTTPLFFSENSQDRLVEGSDNGRLDSEDESVCRSKPGCSRGFPHNHSTATPSNSSNKDSGQGQGDVSKTNVANRKRTRDQTDCFYDITSKKSRIESSSLSASSQKQEKVINGCVSKFSEKDNPHVAYKSSFSSIPRTISSPMLSTSVSEDRSFHHSQSEIFLRQASSESRMSDRSVRDKSKVKTTEQLIEQLQKKNSSSVANSIMSQLRSNQIEKERDTPGSALPVGVKPRGKRGRRSKNETASVPSSDLTLSQAKNEHVARFLKSSDPSSSVGEDSPFKDDLLPDPGVSAVSSKLQLAACTGAYTKDNFDSSFSASRQDRSESAPKDESSMDATSPPFPSKSQSERVGSHLTVEELEALLPPINYDIDWDAVDFYELPERLPVTDEAVNQLHNERLPGRNGVFDMNGDWTNWQQCVTLRSYEDSMLHILPYVDLDN